MSNDTLFTLAFIAYSMFEYWIGKTQKTTATSMIQFVLQIIGKVIFKKSKEIK